MASKLDNAVALYVDGVRDGLLEPALDKYVREDLVQHSIGVPDGRHGLLSAYAPRIAQHANREIWPVRGFADGDKVFLQTYQNWGRGTVELVSCDIFATDADDRIVEHWNVTAPIARWTASGRSQIDGASVVSDRDSTASHKGLVRAYLTEVLVGGAMERSHAYLSEELIQHSPQVHDGLNGHLRHLDRMRAEGRPIRYREVVQLIGCGDFTASLCRVEIGASAYAVIDLFRCAGGRIVEHWDAACAAIDTGVNHGPF